MVSWTIQSRFQIHFSCWTTVQITRQTYCGEPFQNRQAVRRIIQVRTTRKVHPVPLILRLGILTIVTDHHSPSITARSFFHIIRSTIATALPRNKLKTCVMPSRSQKLKMANGYLPLIVQGEAKKILTRRRGRIPAMQAAELRNKSTSIQRCPFQFEIVP